MRVDHHSLPAALVSCPVYILPHTVTSLLLQYAIPRISVIDVPPRICFWLYSPRLICTHADSLHVSI